MSNRPLFLLFVLILYVNAFIYVFKKHTKFFGFILMILAFILSLIYIYTSTQYFTEFVDILKMITPYPYAPGVFGILAGIVFLHFFNLTKVLSAYSNRAGKRKSFNLRLNKKFAKYLEIFTISFIIGIGLLFLFVFMQNENLNIMIAFLFALVIAIVTETVHAIKFAKIKG